MMRRRQIDPTAPASAARLALVVRASRAGALCVKRFGGASSAGALCAKRIGGASSAGALCAKRIGGASVAGTTLVLAALFSFDAPAVQAQQASASTAALGLGDSYTALARGADAVAWNPAALGLPDGPGLSMTALTVRGGSGLAPIGLGDLATYSNERIPIDVRLSWLNQIEQQAGEVGAGTIEAAWAALQIGRFAAQVSSSARVTGDVAPGIARLLMLGNADAGGHPVAFDLSGSHFVAHATTTFAASYGLPIQVGPNMVLALGATAKYTLGHFVGASLGSDGAADDDPVAIVLELPVVTTATEGDGGFNGGGGFGLDLGAALRVAPWTFALGVKNALSGFAWESESLEYRALALDFQLDGTITDTDAHPLAEAPDSVRAFAESLVFEPVFAIGVGYDASSQVRLAADLRFASESGLHNGANRHVGAGVEYRPLPWLPLRFGAASVSMGPDDAGYFAGGGVGLDLGGWNLAASTALRDTERLGSEQFFMITLVGTGMR